MNTIAALPNLSADSTRHSVERLPGTYLSEDAAETLSVQVADSFLAVEALRPIWNMWAHSLDTDLDYYLHTLKSDPTILHPYVITVCRGSVPQAILAGQVRKRRVSSVVSFMMVRGPLAKVLEVSAGGRMGPPSPTIDKVLAGQLHQALAREADMLCFHRLPLESDLFREVRRAPGLLMKERVPDIFRYSVVPLATRAGKRPQALSGKNRREARRKTRILQRAFPGKVHFRCFSPAELEAGLNDALLVEAATWQHYMGDGLLNTPQARENLVFCAGRGWLRIYVMYIENTPVAFLVGQHYQKTFYCQFTGYHPDFGRYSVGSLLTSWALETLSAAGIEQVDLGEGGQEHNRRLGCRVREEGTVHVYSPTLRGLYVRLFFAATQAIRTSGRSTREGLRLNSASSAWSRFLMGRWKSRQAASVGDKVRRAA